MKFISKLKSSKTIERVSYFCLIFFVFLYVFAVPSFGSRSGLSYSVYLIFAVLSGLVLFYTLLFKKFTFNRYLIFVPLFIGYALLGTLLFSHQLRGWLTLFLLGISFFVLYYAFQIIEHKFVVLSIIVFGIFAYSLYYIFHYRSEIIHFSSFGSEAFRLGDYFDNQNDVAACCLAGFSLSIYLLLFSKKLFKLIFIFPSMSIFLVGLTTGSRTFILASVLIFLVFLYFRMRNHKLLYLISLIVFIGLLFVFINFPFMATIKERLLKMVKTFFTSSNTVDTSAISRSIWLDYGVFLGSKHIIFGLGYGGFSIFSGVGTFTHSNTVEVFCDFGLPGLLLFYSPYFALVCLQIKNRDRLLQLTLPLFVLYFAISFSMVFFYNKMYYLIIALLSFISISSKEKDLSGVFSRVLGS